MPRFRIQTLMIVVALAATTLGAVAEYGRLVRQAAQYRALSQQHASTEETLRWLVQTKGTDYPIDVSPGPGRPSRRYSAAIVADWEANLKHKYERAARRPWLPVAPDPVEPPPGMANRAP